VAVKYQWDDFVIDVDAYRLERASVALQLEPKAFNLLLLLIERPGHVFTKQEIFDRLWPGTVVTDHALTRVVAQLRRVLGDEARDGRYIETVPTRGYRWLPKVQLVAETAQQLAPPAVVPVTNAPARWSLSPWQIGLAAVVVLLGLVAWTQRAAPPESAQLSASDPGHSTAWPVQLTTHAGLDLHPSFSPQGDAVAFASDRSGTFELYVRALSGHATEVALTADGRHNVQPAWSPDGSSIAYYSHGRGGIWIMPARGGTPRQLVAEGSHPAWSADGRRIAFQSDEPADVTPSAFGAQSSATINVVNADGTDRRPLTTAGQPFGGHASPAWTRDGRFVAFSVFEGGDSNGVWVVSTETGKVLPLLRGRRGLYEIAFAPDDSSIYVAGGEPFITRIRFDPIAGTASGERELIPVPGASGVRGLAAGPDRTLGFAGMTISSQIWLQPVGADGSGRGTPRALTTDTSRRNSYPVISPDGRRVAYVSTRSGEPPNVWLVGIDGTDGSQLTNNDGPDIKPNWLPDGKRIAFISNRQNRMGLWSIDLETRREEPVARLDGLVPRMTGAVEGLIAEPSLSRSLERFAVAIIAPPRAHRQIFVSPTTPLELRAASDPSQWVGYPAWSPDERRLAVEVKDGSATHAGVIDLETGTLRRLTNERGQTWVKSWSPDGRKIAAATFRNGTWDLRWIDASSGATGVITAASAPSVYVRYPDWSPRGDAVVYERGDLRGNVWMVRLADKPDN